VRVEDVDRPRCRRSLAELHLQQLAACGLHSDAPVVWQSQRSALYEQALQRLHTRGLVYFCVCSRKDIAAALAARGPAKPRFGTLVYPGTCRNVQRPAAAAMRLIDGSVNPGDTQAATCTVQTSASTSGQATAPAPPLAAARSAVQWFTEPEVSAGSPPRQQRATRLRVPPGTVHWHDRRLGPQQQDVATEVGDFVLHRADGLWAYQLAVVVDDAEQGVTHVVRGEDLADNTARQLLLQRALGLPEPKHLHTPLVLAADGHKLSKQNGALALDLSEPVAALRAAGQVLGLPPLLAGACGITPAQWLQAAVPVWARMHALRP
jgi:glutamyl-Q tRNA(Asp) synthetase